MSEKFNEEGIPIIPKKKLPEFPGEIWDKERSCQRNHDRRPG